MPARTGVPGNPVVSGLLARYPGEVLADRLGFLALEQVLGGMRPWPVPPFLIASTTRSLVSAPTSSRFGPVSPLAPAALSVWQRPAGLSGTAPCPPRPRRPASPAAAGPCAPSPAWRSAITSAGTAMPEHDVEHREDDAEPARAAREVASRAPLRRRRRTPRRRRRRRAPGTPITNAAARHAARHPIEGGRRTRPRGRR